MKTADKKPTTWARNKALAAQGNEAAIAWREKVFAAHKAWQEKNPDKVRAYRIAHCRKVGIVPLADYKAKRQAERMPPDAAEARRKELDKGYTAARSVLRKQANAGDPEALAAITKRREADRLAQQQSRARRRATQAPATA